jgi:hypothetical protein
MPALTELRFVMICNFIYLYSLILRDGETPSPTAVVLFLR